MLGGWLRKAGVRPSHANTFNRTTQPAAALIPVRLPRLVGHARAMDLILTGRPVGAREALDFGLVNRVVPPGGARAHAEALAAEIARMPQTTMRGDRRSARSQWGQSEETAMFEEFEIGMTSLQTDGIAGAGRFAEGAGRHGSSEDI